MKKKGFEPGDKISLYKIIVLGKGRRSDEKRVVKKVWTVIKAYPHFVLCKNSLGTRECFSYWHIRRYGRMPVKVIQNGVPTLAFE